MAFPLGVVGIAYATEPSVVRQAELAREDGFDHIDVVLGADEGLALPVGCPISFPKPVAQWCATPAPPAGDGAWERTVRWWTAAAPLALCEPWGGASVSSIDDVRALTDAVPGIRFLIDTGHVTAWGGDILELLPYAGNVQLRDAKLGQAQAPAGEGDVDFGAVLRELDRIGYVGVLSIEYFDLPEHGWSCADPRAEANALRELITALG